MSTRDHRDEIAFHVDEEDSECEVSEAAVEQPFPIGGLLREEVERELESREGAWGAFEAGVLRRIGEEHVAEGRMSLEDRAIAAFKAQVEGEIADLAPDFSRRFRDGVEARIWQAAKEKPTLAARVAAFLSSLLQPGARGLAFAATAVAVVFALVFSGQLELGSGDEDLATADGPRVYVDEVSFEGSATVMSEGAVTVVWLTDPTS